MLPIDQSLIVDSTHSKEKKNILNTVFSQLNSFSTFFLTVLRIKLSRIYYSYIYTLKSTLLADNTFVIGLRLHVYFIQFH